MCFEFFLQNKPVIFYSLNDAEDCRKRGHAADVVSPYLGKENLLPNIVTDQDELTKLLMHYVNNGFQLSTEEKEKQNLFFYYKSGFCERFRKYLIDHLQEKKTFVSDNCRES
jgi:hypothetical protein